MCVWKAFVYENLHVCVRYRYSYLTNQIVLFGTTMIYSPHLWSIPTGTHDLQNKANGDHFKSLAMHGCADTLWCDIYVC